VTSQGLIGFHIRDVDKLAHNAYNSTPDKLGLSIYNEVLAVTDWDEVYDRVKGLNAVPETSQIDLNDGLLFSELRRHFPEKQFNSHPRDYHELFSPLQGSLAPYLDGRLSYIPDASDFIHDSRFCDWAYIVNLDTQEFEVWMGRQIEPEHEGIRLTEEENRYGTKADRMGYYPCMMYQAYNLNDLPGPQIFLQGYCLLNTER
jgi:hypothetical protein